MKLEFLADGSEGCPLIRLYGFDLAGALRLREAFRSLADGVRQDIPLHEEWWIETVEECHLDLRLGVRNLGVVQRLPMKFECVLTAQAWMEIVGLTDPFCTHQDGELYRWLNRDGEVLLLLSPTGKW
jgi:hypothetical protein